MKYSIKQARKALQVKGKPKITYDNILDYVALSELDLYVRYCKWIGKNNIHNITVKNKKIWSDNSTDNLQNIEIIRKALRTKTKFKLILCEKIRDEHLLTQADIETYAPKIADAYTTFDGNRISIKKLGVNSKGLFVLLTEENKAECTTLLESFTNSLPTAKIKDFKNQFPSRYGKVGPYETTKESNTSFSESISLEDVYFLKKDILALKSIQSEEKQDIAVSENQNEINSQAKNCSIIDIEVEVDISWKNIHVIGHKSPYKWNEIFGTNNNQWEVIKKLAKNKGIVSSDEWKDVFPDSRYEAVKGHVTRTGKVLQEKLKLDKNPLSAGIKKCSSKFKSIKIHRNVTHDALNKINPNQDGSAWLKEYGME